MYGTITIGRLELRETFRVEVSLNASTGDRSLSMEGQESCPPLATIGEVRARQEDILDLRDRTLQIVFTDKSDHDGYYLIEDANSDQVNYQGEVITVGWKIRATYLGPDNAVDVESRLTTLTRANPFGVNGEHWHAPSIGHTAYWTGSSLPSGSVQRTTAEDGVITVYRAVPDVTPRWGCPVASYPAGRVRLTLNGLERTADNLSVAGSGWSVDNGLVKVAPSAVGSFRISTYDGTAWRDLDWNASVGASAASGISGYDAVTVLRNDLEAIVVRAVKGRSPGRTLIDWTIRRGSRFVEGLLTTTTSATIGLWLAVAQNQTSVASGGYQAATVNDGDGNRVTAGSAVNFTPNSSGGFYVTAATSLPFYVGSVIGGDSAQSGDSAIDLRNQYIGVMPESIAAVRR